MRTMLLAAALLSDLLCVSKVSAQSEDLNAAELRTFAQKGNPYRTCINNEFSKLRTPNLGDQDVFPLLRISDDALFATVSAPCDAQRNALVAEMPSSEAFAKIVENWQAAAEARFRRIAGQDRPTLTSKAQAIRAPGPRSAVPLVEFITGNDYSNLMSTHEQGRITATYTVGVDGRTSNCKAVGGPDSLTSTTCSVISRRWRYAPALDGAGQPTVEVRTKTLNLKND